MADLTVLHNPCSRRGRRVAALVRETLAARGGDLDTSWVALSELAERPLVANRLVVIGGDGTVNAAVGWLDRCIRRSPKPCPVGIVPAGTGNNLARGLGLPLDPREALSLALESTRTRGIDAIRYRSPNQETRLIVQTSALGFPAEIAARYDRWRRHRLFRWVATPTGPYVYRILALLGLAGQKRRERRGDPPLRVQVELEGESLEEDVFAVFIGNETSLGGNFYPCPRAKVDDGALDICLVRAGTKESYLRIFHRITQGRHLELEGTVLYRQSGGPVDIKLSEVSPFLVDGDLWVRSDSYHLEVVPGCFDVVVPAR